ncbi:hypothetical protein EVAR_75438_1 [Eumeta japonica]|uniref:Uncharacterized protein n=1 Tax=Eumeta variegata TaxID=151549 RepID=A0A4C1TK32_EUMVA|nr:hypothetical protein EVAR_75438_1 [Eumeta japonica]
MFKQMCPFRRPRPRRRRRARRRPPAGENCRGKHGVPVKMEAPLYQNVFICMVKPILTIQKLVSFVQTSGPRARRRCVPIMLTCAVRDEPVFVLVNDLA